MKKIEKVKIGGRLCGEFFTDKKLFLKKVKRSVHLFRKMDAWGIDSRIIDAISDNGCRTIKIWEREEKKSYEISMTEWKEKAIYLNLQHGLQQFVNLEYFKTEGLK